MPDSWSPRRNEMRCQHAGSTNPEFGEGPRLRRYSEPMGWTDVPYYTINTKRFSADCGVNGWFVLNVFLRDGDDVYGFEHSVRASLTAENPGRDLRRTHRIGSRARSV